MRNNGTSIAAITADLDNQITNIDSMWSLATPSYSDQVLPFNVTLSGANEYGAMTCGKILGIEIVVLDQVFPSFRPVCHLCTPLPKSVVETSFQSMLALVFVFMWLAQSRRKRLLPVAGFPVLLYRLKVRKSVFWVLFSAEIGSYYCGNSAGAIQETRILVLLIECGNRAGEN